MSRFKRIKDKSNKKSSVLIDEKIVALNKELKKTDMLSEVMTTSNVYTTTELVPYDPGGEFPVPDTSGVTGDGFTQPVSGNPDDSSNWPDAYTDNSWMFNSNDVGGESNRPIVASMDQGVLAAYAAANPGDDSYPTGGAGIVFGDIAFGTGVGFAKGGFFKQVLNPGLFGNGSTKIVPPGSPYGAPFFGLFGMYLASVEKANVIMAMSGAYINAGGYTTDSSKVMPVLLWRNHSNFHDGPYDSYSGKKFQDDTGSYVLQTFYMFKASNTFFVNPTPEHQNNIQIRGTEDPPIYPGPIATLFGLGARAFEWLFGRAKKENEEKDYERNRRTNRPKPVGSKPEPDPIPEPDPSKSEPDPEKDYERNRYNNRPEVKAGVPIKNAITALGNFATDPLGAVADFFGNNLTPPAAEYSTNIAKSVFFNRPITVKQEDIPKGDIDKFFKNFSGKLPISNGKPTPYADENFYVDDKGNVKSNIGPNGEKAYYKKNNTGSVGSVDEIGGYDNPLAAAGQAQTQFVVPDDGSEPYFLYTDHAYHNLTSDDPGEVPDPIKTALSGALHALTGKGDPTKPNTGGMSGYPPNVKGDVKTEFKIPYSQLPENIKAKVNFELKYQELLRTGKAKAKFESFDVSNISESVALGHFEPEELNVDIEDLRKGIMPEYPKQPPAEMIDGYHEKSRIRPKNAKNEEPYLKIDKTDLIRNHRIKSSEADEMMDTINMINDYIKKHPEDMIHAQMRYPVDDPRLAELNWKMDQMLEAGSKYMDSNFKENKKLFKRATEHTLKNIKVTDPKYVQQKYDELRGTSKPKKTKLVGRLGKHLNKYESKSLFKHVNSKDFKKISERKLEKKKFLEKQEQERLDFINDINAEMDEFRSDWRNEIKEQPVFKAVPVDTGKMTSSQSFAIFPNFPGSTDTGVRLDLDGGLGRDNSLANTDAGFEDPNFTGIFQFPTEAGGFVPAINFKAGGEINSAQINYGDFPLSGYAMPLGGDMYRSITQRKKEEINKELDSSEEYTKQIKADALMKARVEDGPTVVKIYKASDFTPGEGLADRYPPEQLQKLSVQNPQKFSEYKHISDIADEMTKKVETSFEKIDQEYSDQWEPKLSSLLPSNQYSDLYKKHGGSAFSEVNIEINRLYNEEQKAMTRVKTKDGVRLRSNKKSRAIRATANKISDAIPTLQELQNKLDDIRQSKMNVVEAENRREMKALQKAAPEFFFPHGELKPLDLYMEPFGADLKTMSDIEKYASEPTTKSMTGNEVNNLDNKQINTAVKDVGSSFGPNIGTGFKIFGDFLTKGYNDRFVADRKYLGKEYMNRQFFPNVSFDRDGTYVKKDVVVGSGQPAKYNESTGMIEIRATFDFKTNAQEVAGAIASEKGEKADWASRFNRTGSKYALDAIVDPLPGVLKPLSGMVASHLISTAKFVGKGNLIPIVIKITPEELKLKNKKAYKQLVELGVIPKDK